MPAKITQIEALLRGIHESEGRAQLAWEVVRTSLGELDASVGALDEFVKAMSDVAAGSSALISYIHHEGGA